MNDYLEDAGERAVEDAEPELTRIKSPVQQLEAREKVKADRIASLKLLWTGGSLDEWLNPLRPANINNGPSTVYKGGRRPLDIYWRIAKGINGAKMPAHYPQLKPEEIWDLVNFVLAMPTNPDLLDDAAEGAPPPTFPTAAPSSTASK